MSTNKKVSRKKGTYVERVGCPQDISDLLLPSKLLQGFLLLSLPQVRVKTHHTLLVKLRTAALRSLLFRVRRFPIGLCAVAGFVNRSGGGNLVDPNKLADYAQLQEEAEVLASDWETV